ncbi:MAG: d(CMP) kinase [Aestuariivita sp.]|nr:d(CMP) kinase [Aestuariivita sp.]MCY4346842.1 d(CMP) kinase [Aestuariivita sp.]
MAFVVAIDGPAAAGKGTVARAVAGHFGLSYLDTGLLYRAVGLAVNRGKDAIAVAQKLDLSQLNDRELRTQAAAEAASKVACEPDVREALIATQREFAQRRNGAVLDGRDIGTVICPNANVKLYVFASPEVRAARRYNELTMQGSECDYQTVLKKVQDRDALDEERATAPLAAAVDAKMLDTTSLKIDEAVARAISIIEQARRDQ